MPTLAVVAEGRKNHNDEGDDDRDGADDEDGVPWWVVPSPPANALLRVFLFTDVALQLRRARSSALCMFCCMRDGRRTSAGRSCYYALLT